MGTVLFINACMRGKDSNTLKLCQEYLSKKDKDMIEEVTLNELQLAPLTGEKAAYRMEKQAEKNWDDPIFEYAKQMAQADEIVIGTPYWDLSFPAALKTYLEYCCVCDITFHYTNEGRPEGLCKSKTMTYITTSGGFIADKNYGYDYLCGLADMLSLGKTRFISAEGLDIIGMDVEGQMEKARNAISELD